MAPRKNQEKKSGPGSKAGPDDGKNSRNLNAAVSHAAKLDPAFASASAQEKQNIRDRFRALLAPDYNQSGPSAPPPPHPGAPPAARQPLLGAPGGNGSGVAVGLAAVLPHSHGHSKDILGVGWREEGVGGGEDADGEEDEDGEGEFEVPTWDELLLGLVEEYRRSGDGGAWTGRLRATYPAEMAEDDIITDIARRIQERL